MVMTVEQAELQVAQGMADMYAKLANTPPAQIPALMETLEKARREGVSKLVSEAKAEAERVGKERDAATKGFTTTMLGLFTPLWTNTYKNALRKIAELDSSVSRFTLYVDVTRETDDKGVVTKLTIAEPMASVASKVLRPRGGGTGSGKGQALKVNTPSGAKEYASARAAQVEILGDDAQRNRAAIVSAINAKDGFDVVT